MRIIALMGKDGTGKSTTLRQLIQLLTDDPYGSFICKKDKIRFETTSGDICLPILFHRHLLTITTVGDAPSFLKPCFEQYEDFAEIIVCATHRERTAAYRYLESFREKGHIVDFIPKTTGKDPRDETSCNQQDATKLKNIIEVTLKTNQEDEK